MVNLIYYTNKVLGIDTSHHNLNVDYKKAYNAGARFCFHKATESSYFVDPKLFHNFKNAKEAGLYCGVYHFYRDRAIASRQFEHMKRTIEVLENECGFMDLPPALDVEENELNSANVEAVLMMMEDYFQCKPILYTNWSIWNVLNGKIKPIYPLWVANYTTRTEPRLPEGYTNYIFWQFSADGNGFGKEFGAESKDIDLNWFNGTEKHLQMMCQIDNAFKEFYIWKQDMNVRELPRLNSKVIGIIKKGTTERVKSTIQIENIRWAELGGGGYTVIKNLNSGNVYGEPLVI